MFLKADFIQAGMQVCQGTTSLELQKETCMMEQP